MSETVTLTNGANGTIYGTFAGAESYLKGMFGDQYDAWTGLADDDSRKRTLIASARYLNRLSWTDVVNTFALRDALVTADVDAVPLFQNASYELAALVADDPSVLAVDDQGSNIQSVDAGGAGVTYFNPTSTKQGTSTRLPQILMDLIGDYLSSSALDGPDGGDGQSGSCRNPFDHCHDLERSEPY